MDNSRQDLLAGIYSRLIDKFGHRRWWPGETADEVVIGAILTQSVSWRNVEKAIDNLKKDNLLSLKAIENSSVSRLASLIHPTRFYNEKARKLKNFTKWFFSKYQGSFELMFSREVDKLRQEMLDINGLGEETVDSILLYAGNKMAFVIDAYTIRIMTRLGIAEDTWKYREYQRLFMDNIEKDVGLYNDFHAQMVKLGHVYCRKNSPLCPQCPLQDLCHYVISFPTPQVV